MRQQQKPQQNLIQPHRLHTGQSDQIKGFHKLMEHLKVKTFENVIVDKTEKNNLKSEFL